MYSLDKSQTKCIRMNLLLSAIDKIENSLCSICGQPIQDTSQLILYCPATDFLHHLHYGNFFPVHYLWSGSLEVAPLVELRGF